MQANTPYVLFVIAYNITFLLGYIIVGIWIENVVPPPSLSSRDASSFSRDTDTDTGEEVPELFQAINRNGLVVFLIVRFTSSPLAALLLSSPLLFSILLSRELARSRRSHTTGKPPNRPRQPLHPDTLHAQLSRVRDSSRVRQCYMCVCVGDERGKGC